MTCSSSTLFWTIGITASIVDSGSGMQAVSTGDGLRAVFFLVSSSPSCSAPWPSLRQWCVHGRYSWSRWCSSLRCLARCGPVHTQEPVERVRAVLGRGRGHQMGSAPVPQLQFIHGRRHPCLYAEADLHCPDCGKS